MQIEKCKLKIGASKPISFRVSTLTLLALFAAALPPGNALADGGTLQISRQVGALQVSVFTSPVAPRVGLVDISILVQEVESGRIRHDVPASVRLEPLDQPGIPQESLATSAAATNKLLRAAQFDLPQPGRWRVIVMLGAVKPESSLSFELAVAPTLPSWLGLAPWVSWPFIAVGLFLTHQALAARRQKTRPAPSVELN